MAASSTGPLAVNVAVHTSLTPSTVNGVDDAVSDAGATGLRTRPAGTSIAVTPPSGAPAVPCPISPVAARASTPSTVSGNPVSIGTTTTLSPAAMWAAASVDGVWSGASAPSAVCWEPKVSRIEAPGSVGVTCTGVDVDAEQLDAHVELIVGPEEPQRGRRGGCRRPRQPAFGGHVGVARLRGEQCPSVEFLSHRRIVRNVALTAREPAIPLV